MRDYLLFIKQHLKVVVVDNILTCSACIEDINIVAYRLCLGTQIIQRLFTDLNRYQIKINRNGNYHIMVSFYYKGELYHVNSDVVRVDLESKDKNTLWSMVRVEPLTNKILINVSKLAEHVQKVVKCSLLISGEVIKNIDLSDSDISDVFFQIKKTGRYSIFLYYSDFNSNINQLEYDINAEYIDIPIVKNKSLSSKKNNVILFSIVYAFILREFQRKYDKGYLRYFSIVLGPAVQIGILVTIFTLMGRNSNAGLGIPLFVITGILPYTFFTSAGNCLTVVSGNRSLLSYRQVKIIDIIMSNVLMELLVVFVVFCGGLIICWYLGVNVVIYNPLSLILSFILLFIITFGLSMILAVIGFYFAEFNYAIQVVFRALFYISGVFFSIENIPVQYQKYVLWNPLLQIIEFIRFSFVSFDLPHELSYLYLFKCTIVIFLIGISLYFVNRNKFMVNDRAR